MAEIILDHITKRFPDGALAVDDFNLDIADGEFVILVGPSGCGKSTTLNMIAGLEDITAGELRIGGKVVNNKSPKDRDIAMVFQSYALYPHMTVRENMGFALKLAKTPQATINEKVEEAARILDLTQHLDRKPANLSGGQRQRVAMGRAIVRDPAVFLMDEPLSNLDAKLRVQMRTEVSRIQRRLGTTTVYVTHDQTEAMTLGDRVAVMRSGLLQQVGSPEGALRHGPSTCSWPGFIGSPAMNFMAGHARGRQAAHDARRHAGQRGAAQARSASGERAGGDRGPPAGELRGRLAGRSQTGRGRASPSRRTSTCWSPWARTCSSTSPRSIEARGELGRTGGAGPGLGPRGHRRQRRHGGRAAGRRHPRPRGRGVPSCGRTCAEMHVFDPASGRNLSLDTDDGGAGTAPAASGGAAAPQGAVPTDAAPAQAAGDGHGQARPGGGEAT